MTACNKSINTVVVRDWSFDPLASCIRRQRKTHCTKQIAHLATVALYILTSFTGSKVVHGSSLKCAIGTTPYTLHADDTIRAVAETCQVAVSSIQQAKSQVATAAVTDLGRQVCIPSGCFLADISSTAGSSTSPSAPASHRNDVLHAALPRMTVAASSNNDVAYSADEMNQRLPVALPAYGRMLAQAKPHNAIIYSDSLSPGWIIDPSTSPTANYSQIPRPDLNGSTPLCITLHPEDRFSLRCPNGTSAGHQPLALNSTSGINYMMTITNAELQGKQVDSTSLPLYLTVGIDDASHCKFDQKLHQGSVYERLYQSIDNTCMSKAPYFTTLGWTLLATDQVSSVSLCINKIQLLPSSVVVTNETEPVNRGLRNCLFDDRYPVDQFGSYIVGSGFPGGDNLTGPDYGSSYTFFDFMGIPSWPKLDPVLGSCFSTIETRDVYQTRVEECALASGSCCYNFTAYPLTEESSIPDFMVNLCNAMSANGSVCQSVLFESSRQVGWFKGSAPNKQLNLTSTCWSPNVTIWALNAAVNAELQDQRPIVSELTPSTPLSLELPYCTEVGDDDEQTLATEAETNDKIMNSSIAQSLNESSAVGYTVFQHMRVPDYNMLGSSCFSVPAQTASMGFVDQCMREQDRGTCCVHLEQFDGSGTADAAWPATLAQICDEIRIKSNTSDPTVCQGFVYNSAQKIAYFKGQRANMSINLNDLCYSPRQTLWLLNAALPAYNGTDTRVQPGSTLAAAGPPPAIGTAPAVNAEDNSGKGHNAQAAYAAIVAILGPIIPILGWLIVTYSYRQTKHMIIQEVGNHVTEHDVGSPGPWAARSYVDSAITNNPLSDPAMSPIVTSTTQATRQTTARQIAARSLRRWDAFLGFRASHDGLGNAQGVWKARFDGVRFAVLLLAMRKLNDQIKFDSAADGQPQPGNLLEAWQSSNRGQQTMLVNKLAKVLQTISEAEAQELADKDPDVAGMHDHLCTLLACSCRK